MQGIAMVYKSDEMIHPEPLNQRDFFKLHRKTLLLSITMISIFLIVGCLLNPLLTIDVSMESIYDTLPVYRYGLGAVNGYVVGLPELS
ncbi:MAG TPA: hypothetical protein VLE21_02860, partial [Candidatus Nitrosocosmicus sp.]|nr:hypothetical protein [Candidatus Nitrosocosmicus sp.]